jgi:sugar phosphate permease
MIPALAWALNTHGWRTTAFASGILIIALGLPAAQLLRHKPEEYGYLPDGAGPSSGPSTPSRSLQRNAAIDAAEAGFSAREAMRTPAFWLVSIGHAAALLVVGAMMVHLIPHLVERIGLSLQTAAMVVSVVTAMDITGRLLGGYLGDRINKRIGVAGCLLGHAVALAILAYSTSLAPAILFAVIHGLAWGIRGPLIMSLRADYFGRVAYATILGFSSLIMMIGMIIGPLLAGFMADRLGDYRMGFTILAGLAGMGSVLFLITRRPTPPVRAPRTVGRGRAAS